MNRQDILAKLPERIRSEVTIIDQGSKITITHPYIEDESLYALTRDAIEKLGGEVGTYFDGAMHYYIPKGVTPFSVSMDKGKPPKLGMDSEATYKETGNGFPTEVGVKLVNVDKLVQSPYWPRELNTNNEEFKELVESIRKFGVQGNLLARLKEGRLELVFGHRRLFAARQAGLEQVPVKIRKLSDEEALQIQFEENDKQKHWSAMETAHYLETMMKKLGCKTQEQLAEKLNKSQPWVSTHLMMLKDEIITTVITSSKTRDIPERRARAIRKLPDEAQEEIAKQVEETGKLPSPQLIRDLAQLPKCNVSGCLSRTDVKEWNGRGIHLCPKHMKEAEMNPAKFLGLQRSKEVTEKIEEAKPEKIKDTWEQRKAVMQPQKSKFELAVIQDLQAEGVAIETDREFCLMKTKPDGYNAKKNIAIYIDGPPHEGKEERDDRIRGLLTKRHGCHVLPVKFTHDNIKEREIAKQKIREFLEGF